MKSSERPVIGNLSNLKVVNAGSVIAGPFLCELLAEQGADVIEVESTRVPDMYRMYAPDAFSVDRRNQRFMTLNIPTSEGHEVLFDLCRWGDLLVEVSKGGTWEKWGLTDEVLWRANPKLVIVHISGFGQNGDPKYVRRASFDSIGQAFSGFMAVNGMPEPDPPYGVKPFTADFITGLMGAWAALAAVIGARESGVGESIDVSQFESMARIQGATMADGLNRGVQPPRIGNLDLVGACKGSQRCKDGWIWISVGGFGPVKKMVEFFGLQDDPDFEGVYQSITRDHPERARKFNEKLEPWCAAHTIEEVDGVMSQMGVACSPIMTYDRILENSHWQARQDVVEWDDPLAGKRVRGIGMLPKFKNRPSELIRGGEPYDYDTRDILDDLGYDEASIDELYEKGVLKAGQ